MARTSVLGFTLAGVSVALVTCVLADQLARAREDSHLFDAAQTLALELHGGHADPARVAKNETREHAHAGIRVAVYDGQRFLAGDRALAPLTPGRCRDQGALRVCSRPAGPWSALAARDQAHLREQRETLAGSALLALALTGLGGALVSLAVARAVIKPLWQLREAVQRVPEHDPAAAELGEDEGVLEVDALRASLRAAFTKLGVALSQARRFASDAAHELRTPLATVLGELELAAELASSSERDGILRAHKIAGRLSTLVDRLLILARLDALEACEEVALDELIEEAIDPLPAAARARVMSAGSGAQVRGDRALLIAMLANALENALKFSSGPVRTELCVRDAHAILAVEDQGPGIPKAERERVFLPFYRTRESRAGRVPGHGMGLALIAHVAELHGGCARFADREGGARLEIRLPAVTA